jgi:hypothetical protein
MRLDRVGNTQYTLQHLIGLQIAACRLAGPHVVQPSHTLSRPSFAASTRPKKPETSSYTGPRQSADC